MKYKLIKAGDNDIAYVKSARLYNIFRYAHDLLEEEILKINKYVDKHIPIEIDYYKIIVVNNKKVGCCLLKEKDDGIILEEIYLDEEYRNKGIGTDIIKNILQNNSIVYLWVYKENARAVSLYKKLGFNVIEETDVRYYMKYGKQTEVI